MSEIEVQLKKGVLGLCVLALLSRRDSYAYEIASCLSDAVDMGEGTIYPLMRRMQSEGLVATYLEESPSGPPRKYYRITDTGRARYGAQVDEWRGFTTAVDRLIEGVEAAPAAPAAPDQAATDEAPGASVLDGASEEGEPRHDA